jgi:hypothetical protein
MTNVYRRSVVAMFPIYASSTVRSIVIYGRLKRETISGELHGEINGELHGEINGEASETFSKTRERVSVQDCDCR